MQPRTQRQVQCTAVVTDQAVPEGHKGLHGFLYGEGGAEVHDFAQDYLFREGEDDGQRLVDLSQYVSARASDRPVGVYAVHDSAGVLGYVGYSRNIVAALKAHLAQLGQQRCASVRALVIRNKAMTTRDSLSKMAGQWLAEAGSLPPGNSSEQHLWQSRASGQAKDDKAEYEELKLKMRKAMGENLHDAIENETLDSQQRRLQLISAMESDDWSPVINAQTQSTLENSTAAPPASPVDAAAIAAEASARGAAAATAAANGPPQRVTPFAQAYVHRSIGGSMDEQEQKQAMTHEAVDKALEEVRPYLMADGGNVTTVNVQDGMVYLRLEGACGTCASSTSTMKMGIERALQAAFGEQLKGVEQVDAQSTSATVAGIDGHLDQLRPAIQSYGGSVKVLSMENGTCLIDYNGPPPIGMGIQAAIKDKFPDVRAVLLSSTAAANV